MATKTALFLCGCLWASMLHANTLDRQVIHRLIHATPVVEALPVLNKALSDKDYPAVTQTLAAWEVGSVEYEYLLTQVLLQMRRSASDPKALAFCADLLAYQSETHVLHPEGPLPIPLYPIANFAQGNLDAWKRHELANRLSREFRQNEWRGFEFLAQSGSLESSAALDALLALDSKGMGTAKQALQTKPVTTEDGWYALGLLSIGTQDTGTLGLVLNHVDGARGVQLIKQVPLKLDTEQAFELLKQDGLSQKLQSVALFELSRLPTSKVEEHLIQTLKNPLLGATAATLIAKQNRPSMIRKVSKILLAEDVSSLEQARALLTLRLANTELAKAGIQSAVTAGTLKTKSLRHEAERSL